MTRETKLGLLIGTGIILLIGIVVSDQLSVSNKDGAPTADYGMDTGLAANPNAPRYDQPALTGLDLAPIPGSPGVSGVASPNQGQQGYTQAMQPTYTGAAVTIGEPGVVGNVTPQAPTGSTYGNTQTPPHPTRFEPLPGAALTQQFGNPAPAMSVAQQRHNPEPMPLAQGSTTGSSATQPIGLFDPMPQAPTSMNATMNQPGSTGGLDLSNGNSSALSSPVIKTIKVQQGDTLEGLARKHLGAGKHWPELLKANSDKLKKPTELRVGMELTLPTLAETKSTNTTTQTSANSTTSISDRAGDSPRSYTVQKGDTLFGIAQKQLGNGSKWKTILNANKSLLKGDAGNLKPGMKLTIPSDVAGSTGSREKKSTTIEAAMRGTMTDVAGVTTTTNPTTATTDNMPLLLDEPVDTNTTHVAKPIG